MQGDCKWLNVAAEFLTVRRLINFCPFEKRENLLMEFDIAEPVLFVCSKPLANRQPEFVFVSRVRSVEQSAQRVPVTREQSARDAPAAFNTDLTCGARAIGLLSFRHSATDGVVRLGSGIVDIIYLFP